MNRFKKTIASLAVILLGCNVVIGEIVEGRKPDCMYFCASENLNGQLEEIAFKYAENTAMQEFITYALRETLILPNSLSYLSKAIKQSMVFNPVNIELNGVVVSESYISKDNRAVCVLEIPKSNLNNFEGLDLRDNPIKILDRIDRSNILKLEISLALNVKDNLSVLMLSSPLNRSIQQKPFNGIPEFWIIDTNIITEDIISLLNDNQLLSAIEASLGMGDLQGLVLGEVEKRGYVKSAKFLAGHKVPTKDTLPACVDFLSTLDLNGLELSALSKILIENKCAIDFANVDIQDENFDAAKAEFAQKKPDFNKVIELIHASFLENVTDNAMNLLGRCYEEEGKFNEAMLCYFQTLSINPTQIYVKLNLANAFYALGNSENALLWAKDAVGDKTTSSWAKGEAKKLIEKIENPPVEYETSEAGNIEAPKEKTSEAEVSQEKATEAEIHK